MAQAVRDRAGAEASKVSCAADLGAVGDVDHDLAEVRAGRHVAIRLPGLAEREHAIDHRLDAAHVHEAHHVFEHGAAADIDAHQALGAGQQRSRIDFAAEAADAADDGDGPAHRGARHRFVHSPLAAHFQHHLGADAVGEVQHLVVPLGNRLVIDRVVGAQLARPRQLVVAGRGDDGAQARRARQLQAEDRDAAGAQQQHGIARLDVVAGDEDRVPGGDRGARHGGSLDEGQAGRDDGQRVLVQDDFFGQHAVDVAAQAVAHLVRRRPAFQPVREEGAGHAVADLHPRHTGTDRQHFAGAVRARDDGVLDRDQVVAAGDHQVAVVERDGVHADAHFAQAEVALRVVDALEAVDVRAVKNLVSPHA